MAVAGSVTIAGSVTGLATGSRTYGPVTISSVSPTDATAGSVTTVVLSSGANTITVPSTSCTGCIIQFASASTVGKTLKGVTGDTGIAVTENGTCVLQFDDDGAPASFVITAGSADTGNTTTIWWF